MSIDTTGGLVSAHSVIPSSSRGSVVRAKQLIDGSHLDPDTLRVVYKAFDEAWDTIKHKYASASDIENARLELADAVLSLAQIGAKDVSVLRDGALLVLSEKFSSRSGT